MNVKICNLRETTVSGVKAVYSDSYETHRDHYIEWTPFPISSEFQTGRVMAGLLQAWHHAPVFPWVERHEDNEMFYFVEGTGLMLFMDYVDEKPVLETAQVVRIPEGVTLEIAKGKGHCVAVAQGDTYKVIVISPEQDAPKTQLTEEVCGVE
ncbi:MAG: hypothetical protein RSD95_14855 [Clostridia bacterium]